MPKIKIISDFLYPHYKGGAEINDNVAAKILSAKHEVSMTTCDQFNWDLASHDGCDLYIVSNYTRLNEDSKSFLKFKKYVVIEHDYKFCPQRNPAKFPDFKCPEILNFRFYSSAHAIICQSKLQKDVFDLNLGLPNIINFGGNLWTDEDFNLIENLRNNPKGPEFAILEPDNCGIKGREASINFCRQNNLPFKLIPELPTSQFLDELSKCRGFVFLPSSPETFSRVAAECKMLGLEIICNNLVGMSHESHFSLNPHLFFLEMKKKRVEFSRLIDNLIRQPRLPQFKYVQSKNFSNLFYL